MKEEPTVKPTFNSRLVDSLDQLNKILAVIFAILTVYRFLEMVDDSFVTALFEACTVLVVGVLTCGYIALMINIKDLLQDLVDKKSKE